MAQTKVSLNRILKFLTTDEQRKDAVGDTCLPGEVISIEKATFSWSSSEEPNLVDIDFHVPNGKLIAIIGPVGCGKSSLFSAILGEINKTSGSVNVKGRIAYVPQQAWILNRTLRENILFMNEMKKSKYDSILTECCLRPDLEFLPGGDKTEIGEKGVNLSGGQKQRVSLARAVFHDADIYLLDDPLSAVDSHVGKSLFQNVIGNTGLLKDKTRILITHNINVLPDTDFIVTMKNGRIHETGTYHQLLEQGGVFADFISEHSNLIQSGPEGDISFESKENNTLDNLYTKRHELMRNISTISELSAKLIEDENMEIGKVKLKVYLSYAKQLGLFFFMGILIGNIGFVITDIGLNLWLKYWSANYHDQDISDRNFKILIFTVLTVVSALFKIFSCINIALGSASASKSYHRKMLDSIMKAPMSFFDTTPLGRILNRFGQDVNEVDMSITGHLDSYITCIFFCMSTFLVVGSSTPLFFAFLVPAGILYYIIQKYYLHISRHLKRLLSTSLSPVMSHFAETTSGISSIKAYQAESYFKKTCDQKLNTNILCQLYYFMSNRWLETNVSFIGNSMVLIVAILVISSKGYLQEGTIGLILTYVLTLTDDLTWVVYTGTELENKFVSVERIEEYSQLPSEAPWTISETAPAPSWPVKGELELKQYSTRYRDGLDLVLKNVNLHIGEHEKVGIVGRTGAGKSSFSLALFRIIEPSDGQILIDNVDISKIGLHQLRPKLTIIPQDPTLFTGTLRMNLDPNNEHSDEEVWSGLEKAHLKSFVSSLTEGLYYEIAEKGENLSVGQRQLVCLARSLLRKAKILILDEATAAVDMNTDRLIQDTIRTEFNNYTIITIAHRLNTILDYDRVIVLDAGEINEIGKPSELLQNADSKFYSMAKDAGLL